MSFNPPSTFQLYYSQRCPKSREIIDEILKLNLRSKFVLISIDKHIENKRKMPKGIRITPTVHRETNTQIHVYEGDDIKMLINQLKSENPVQSNIAAAGNKNFGAPIQQNPNPFNNDFITQKPIVIEDTSWQTSREFGMIDKTSKDIPDEKTLKAQRDQQDALMQQQIEAQRMSNPALQQWATGGISVDDIKKKV
jgi:hypothetical protein